MSDTDEPKPPGVKLHNLESALFNRQIVEFILQANDPKAIINTNLIPLAPHPSSAHPFTILLIKTGYENEGIGQFLQSVDESQTETLDLTRILCCEYNYHYVTLRGYNSEETVTIGLLVHVEATDMDLKWALQSVGAGLGLFGNTGAIVLGFDLDMNPEIPDPEIMETTAKILYDNFTETETLSVDRDILWDAITHLPKIYDYFGDAAKYQLEHMIHNLDTFKQMFGHSMCNEYDHRRVMSYDALFIGVSILNKNLQVLIRKYDKCGTKLI